MLRVTVTAWIALAFVAVAHGSTARTGDATGPASITAQSFCAELQQGINAETFRFSGWRCSQGPAMRGFETILAWVKMTKRHGEAHIELLWVAETEPVQSAQVIDARKVPGYGYQPSDVREAFRTQTAEYLSA
jgi:hypothetical protein